MTTLRNTKLSAHYVEKVDVEYLSSSVFSLEEICEKNRYYDIYELSAVNASCVMAANKINYIKNSSLGVAGLTQKISVYIPNRISGQCRDFVLGVDKVKYGICLMEKTCDNLSVEFLFDENVGKEETMSYVSSDFSLYSFTEIKKDSLLISKKTLTNA